MLRGIGFCDHVQRSKCLRASVSVSSWRRMEDVARGRAVARGTILFTEDLSASKQLIVEEEELVVVDGVDAW